MACTRDFIRFASNIVIEESGCWTWQRARTEKGYGVFYVAYHKLRAHRWSYEFCAGGVLEDGDTVCHSCDRPECVNPAHLFKGTALANALDSYHKGRSKRVLNEQVVREYKRLRARGMRRMTAARTLSLSVAKQTLMAIDRGIMWAWVKAEPQGLEDLCE